MEPLVPQNLTFIIKINKNIFFKELFEFHFLLKEKTNDGFLLLFDEKKIFIKLKQIKLSYLELCQ